MQVKYLSQCLAYDKSPITISYFNNNHETGSLSKHFQTCSFSNSGADVFCPFQWPSCMITDIQIKLVLKDKLLGCKWERGTGIVFLFLPSTFPRPASKVGGVSLGTGLFKIFYQPEAELWDLRWARTRSLLLSSSSRRVGWAAKVGSAPWMGWWPGRRRLGGDRRAGSCPGQMAGAGVMSGPWLSYSLRNKICEIQTQ